MRVPRWIVCAGHGVSRPQPGSGTSTKGVVGLTVDDICVRWKNGREKDRVHQK